jgi:hypothetical protein
MLSEDERAALVCAEQLQHDPDCGVYAVSSFRALSEQEAKIHQALIARVEAELNRATPLRSDARQSGGS